MTYSSSPFDLHIQTIVAPGFDEIEEALASPRAILDKNDIAHPDGLPFLIETSTGSPFHCEGLVFYCSLRDNGSLLVVHGPEPALARYMADSLMDKQAAMAWAMQMAKFAVDQDVPMANTDGSAGPPSRRGHVCCR